MLYFHDVAILNSIAFHFFEKLVIERGTNYENQTRRFTGILPEISK